jgi:hypothetical protein
MYDINKEKRDEEILCFFYYCYIIYCSYFLLNLWEMFMGLILRYKGIYLF